MLTAVILGLDATEWTAIGTWFAGAATFAAVFVAIFRDWIRQKYVGPKLRIELTPHGSTEPHTRGRPIGRVQYLLKVVNDRPSAEVKNCRVWMSKMVKFPAEEQPRRSNWDSRKPLEWESDDSATPVISFYKQCFLVALTVYRGAYSQLNLDIDGMRDEFYRMEPGTRTWFLVDVEADNVSTQSWIIELAWAGMPGWHADPIRPFAKISDVTHKAHVLDSPRPTRLGIGQELMAWRQAWRSWRRLLAEARSDRRKP